jgi:hypothetical protein
VDLASFVDAHNTLALVFANVPIPVAAESDGEWFNQLPFAREVRSWVLTAGNMLDSRACKDDSVDRDQERKSHGKLLEQHFQSKLNDARILSA